MTDYMKEVERLIEEYGNAEWKVGRMSEHSDDAEEIVTRENARAALLAHIQRGAVPEGDNGKRVLREVFALCEDTETTCSDETGDFARGRRFEAKGIARAIGAWYQEEFCGRSHMGEPAAPAPDQFRDAAKMMAGPAEVPMPEPDTHCYDEDERRDVWSHSADQMLAYGVACRAAGEAAGYARGLAEAGDRIRRGREILDAALRGEVKP